MAEKPLATPGRPRTQALSSADQVLVDGSWSGLAQDFHRLVEVFGQDPRPQDEGEARATGVSVAGAAAVLGDLVEQVEPRLELSQPSQLEFQLYLPNLGRLRVSARRRSGAGWWLLLATESASSCEFLQRHADDCAACLSEGLGEPVSLDVEREATS